MADTLKNPEEADRCIGCGHSLAWHFRDVKGVARCTVERNGVSDRGVIGIPWVERCACAEFVLPAKPAPVREEFPEAFQQAIRKAFHGAAHALKACDHYSRPKGIMGGPCLNCGRSQPEHVRR